MIIDQLTPTLSDNLTDEVPVEQGTITFKTTWQKILDMFAVSGGTPAMDGTGSQGSANTLSRSDHVHPTDTSRLALDGSLANVNPVTNLNNFVTGIAVFDPAGSISNLPNNSTWWLIVASGNGLNTEVQVAYPLSSSYAPMKREESSGSWGSWHPLTSQAKGTITLGTTWSGSDPYTQTVTVSGATVTSNSKVDLQPTPSQLATLAGAGITSLVIENNSGTLTAYALGASLSSSMTIQCTVTEVTS